MGRNDRRTPLEAYLVLALLFILIRLTIGFWLNLEEEPSQVSPLFLETLLGVLLGATIAILMALVQTYLPRIVSTCEHPIHRAVENAQAAISDFTYRTQSAMQDWAEILLSNTAQATFTGQALVGKALFSVAELVFERLIPSLGDLLTRVELLGVGKLRGLWQRIRAPKWYEKEGAVDPGLIEVSLAVTAVIVALPALSASADISGTQAIRFSLLRVFAELIPIGVSIKLIDLYAKERGSNSLHVLVGLIEDGPFFFLSWAILIGFLVVAAVTLGLFAN